MEKNIVVTNSTNTVAANAKAVTTMNQIVALIKVLKYSNSNRGARVSIKGLWESLSTLPMPKAIGTELRRQLAELGFVGGANGSIPMFENMEQYEGLIRFANFSDDSYEVPELDVTTLDANELKLYEQARAMSDDLPRESKWDKISKKYGLEEPRIKGIDGYNIVITGNPFKNLEAIKLDIPEITDYLPEGASIIRYDGTLYFYVTSPCMFRLVLDYTLMNDLGFTAFYYKTFSGGVATPEEQKQYPPCENLPEHTYFESFPDREFALVINSWEDYVLLIERGIYQRYASLTEWNNYDFHINCYFSEPTNEQVDKFFEGYVPSKLSVLNYEDLVAFVKNDMERIHYHS